MHNEHIFLNTCVVSINVDNNIKALHFILRLMVYPTN